MKGMMLQFKRFSKLMISFLLFWSLFSRTSANKNNSEMEGKTSYPNLIISKKSSLSELFKNPSTKFKPNFISSLNQPSRLILNELLQNGNGKSSIRGKIERRNLISRDVPTLATANTINFPILSGYRCKKRSNGKFSTGFCNKLHNDAGNKFGNLENGGNNLLNGFKQFRYEKRILICSSNTTLRNTKLDRQSRNALCQKDRKMLIQSHRSGRIKRESQFTKNNITVETLNNNKDIKNERNSYKEIGERQLEEETSFVNIEENGESFDNNNSPSQQYNGAIKIVAEIGRDALLPCRVGHLGDRQVSWIRKRDWYVLTSGESIYTHDERFLVLHEKATQDWTLHIKRVARGDAGLFECQVSTGTGIISFLVRLVVLTPTAYIPGNGGSHVYKGTPIYIGCYILMTSFPERHVNWYHNGQYLDKRKLEEGKYSIKTTLTEDTPMENNKKVEEDQWMIKSELTVEFAKENHSGNYTCKSPNVKPATFHVYISEGDKTAAVQRIHSGQKSTRSRIVYAAYLILVLASLQL